MMPRVLLLVAGAGLAAAGLACGDAVPCSNCPPLAGRYQMAYLEQSRSADCATVSASPGPPALEIEQTGSAARAVVGSMELVGTVYDTWDFSLAGAQAVDGGSDSDSIAVRGRFIPPASPADVGSLIRGSWEASARRQSAGASRTCTVELTFTGSRQ